MSQAEIAEPLLRWYAVAQRPLPWRQTRDPYAIWLSEVMLQQTQVVTVIPYWKRFLERFPTVTSLAEAELAEVLPFWSGLGYYSRARALHRAAGLIAQSGGKLPSTARELRELPGFGPYTAGAVASIAFGESVPLVDGNVARVLCRLFAIEGDPSSKPVRDRLWALAAELVPVREPGAFNQALMELGACVCTRTPTCLLCPVRASCQALREGRVAQLPSPKVRTPRRGAAWTSASIERDGEILLGRRPESGLFAGLWELPSVEGDVAMLSDKLGTRIRMGKPLARVERTLSHRDLVIRVVKGVLRGAVPKVPPYLELRWAKPDGVTELGMATAMRECVNAVLRKKERAKPTSSGRSSGSARPRRR